MTRVGPLVLLASLALVACGERVPPAAPAASGVAPAVAPVPAAATTNAVAEFLAGAEIQAETDAQRMELRRALADLAEKPAQALRDARYADAQGRPGQRDLPAVLRAHLVPTAPRGINEASFFDDATQPAARTAARALLEAVQASLAPPAAAASR
jgi:hypothetical protein